MKLIIARMKILRNTNSLFNVSFMLRYEIGIHLGALIHTLQNTKLPDCS